MPAKYMQTNVWSQSHYKLANTHIPVNKDLQEKEEQWSNGFAQYLKTAERAWLNCTHVYKHPRD